MPTRTSSGSGHVDTILRGGAVIAWTLSVFLFIVGAFAHDLMETLNYYGGMCLLGMAGMTLTAVVMVRCTVRAEHAYTRRTLARETARALADELEERGLVCPEDVGELLDQSRSGRGVTPLR